MSRSRRSRSPYASYSPPAAGPGPSSRFAADPAEIAAAHALRGEADQAFDWLEWGLPRDGIGVAESLREAKYAPFRQQPRYAALLKRLRLPQ